MDVHSYRREYAQALYLSLADRELLSLGTHLWQSEISGALVKAQLWKRAEEVSQGIEEAYSKVRALREISEALATLQEERMLVSLLQRAWLFAETRDYALNVFPLASHILVNRPFLDQAFFDSFEWVKGFLGK
jgi:hypothetical protein